MKKKIWIDGKMMNLGDKGAWKFPDNHKWYNIDKEKEVPEIMVYDVIGDDWDGVTAKQFIKELNAIDADEILVRINSPGGLVYEGLAIYHALRQFKGTVRTRVDAVAASIASVIFMGGDIREMPKSSDAMIHKPWSFVVGDANDFRAEADELDRIQEKIIDIYEDHTNMSREDITEKVNATTWIDGVEAHEMGFATDLLEDAKIAACSFDINLLPDIPERHKKVAEATRKRSEEKNLREGGLSKRDAKTELSQSASRDDGSKVAEQAFIELLNQIGG